ncbi:MAG: UDP-N-acetylmuramate dehydrogenase [Treponema sp.]|nr:UDP-N-acetylmuramate dehydrogenase [Candidatus Treponema caballi]
MVNLRKIAENFNMLPGFTGTVKYDEPMNLHTTFKIGGPAAVFIEPDTAECLQLVCQTLDKEDAPFFVIGAGSNLVVSDDGLDCFVVSTQKISFISEETVTDTENMEASFLLHCGAGLSMDDAAKWCADKGLSGLEAFAGLPGTAGGALFMNARCYGVSVSDVLVSAAYLDSADGYRLKKYCFADGDWDYKKSPFQDSSKVIVSADFRVREGNPGEIAAECEEHIADRDKKGHFSHPSAGSVFKNNRAFGKPSGQIIDEAGLRGVQIGGAQIAPWHGNFIINTGSASAEDVRQLVDYVISVVKAKTGFVLESEIIFV